MKLGFYLPYLLVSILIVLSNQLPGQELPMGFIQTQLVDELDPTSMSIAPDGRIFITEKNGKIRLVIDGNLQAAPFLTIKVDNFNERGLSGLTFDPNFESNSYLYVYYTVPGNNRNRLSRFTANGNTAIPSSEKILIEFEPLAGAIHNGGGMAFGKDGKLYIAVGDGSDGNLAQNLNSTSGNGTKETSCFLVLPMPFCAFSMPSWPMMAANFTVKSAMAKGRL
jgi:glucose/arabinose dehydrogenase